MFFKYKLTEEEKKLISIAKRTKKTYEDSAKAFVNVPARKGLQKINASRAQLIGGLLEIIEKTTR